MKKILITVIIIAMVDSIEAMYKNDHNFVLQNLISTASINDNAKYLSNVIDKSQKELDTTRIYRNLVQNRKQVNLPSDILTNSKPQLDLPPLLCNDGTKGVTELSFNVALKAGVYEFSMQHGVTRNELNRVSSQAYIVCFDDKEIGFGAAQAIDFTEEERDISTDFRCRFICLEEGLRTITVKMIHPWNDFSPNQPFPLYGISLKSYEIKRHRATIYPQHPGRVLLDAWGWHTPLTYQRDRQGGYAPEPPPLDYFKSQAIDESFRWGANVTEFYPVHDQGVGKTKNCWPMEWKANDPIKGAEYYNWVNFRNWSDQHSIELCRHAHRRDFLFHWFGHYPTTLGGNDPYEMYSQWVFNLLEKTSRDFADVLTLGWNGAFDGFASETCNYSRSAFFVEINKKLWKYNPGAYQIENRGPNWDRPMTACTPNFMLAQASNHMHWNGYDDKDPIVAYDRKVEHGSLGRNFFLFQADCREWSPNFFGGNTRPDYVLKQCNDFFRGRAEHPENMLESAIWWLNESRITGSEEMRRYVYGITQDPIKCAVTCNLGPTGVGGTMDRLHRTDMAEYDGAPRYQTRARSEYFHDTPIIQNNFFRAYFHTNIDGGVLLYDLEGLAHYDSYSLAVPISRDFISTVAPGGGKFTRKGYYIEPAGYKAVYEEEAEIQSGQVQERRTVTMHSDTPYFKVQIQRESEISELGTRIGLEHYESMTIDGEIYLKAVSLDCPKMMVFSDNQGILPELMVFVLKPGQIRKAEWEPGKALVFQSEDIQLETIELAFAVLENKSLRNVQMDAFLQAMQQGEQEVHFGKKEVIEISNPNSFAVVRILKITDPDSSPYQVCESGWWMFRGAQPGLEHPDCDYLKVYIPARGTVKVRRYGFIDSVVKNGWGCQYMMAIGEVKSDRIEKSAGECVAKVFNVTPLIFAPRVEFAQKIASVMLDGKPWHYFDEDLVFLPNRPGTYRINVEYGEPVAPHLTRSYGVLESSHWDGKNLTLNFGLPPWVNKLYPDLKLTGMVKTEGQEIESVKEASVIYQTEKGVVIEYSPGYVVVELE